MRSLIAVVATTFFLWATWHVARTGQARSLAEYGSESRQLSLADEAVKLSPSDPETHYNRAALLWATDDKSGAVSEAERTVALRPRDYFVWFRLGFYRYYSEDLVGALSAFREASRLAPYYAQPHYFMGHIMLRQGQRDEAFAELRRAFASDPELLGEVIILAGETFGDDSGAIEQAIQPQSAAERLALASYLIQEGKTAHALALFRSATNLSQQDRRGFLTELLDAKLFPEAYEVWSSARTTERGGADGSPGITDGGFENEILIDDPGFGWQFARDIKTVQFALDDNEPHAGAHSLRIDFEGNSDPSAPLVWQLVLVDPKTHYRLSFAARTEGVVTGGLPVLVVTDASNDKTAPLTSLLLPQGTTDWRDYSVEFTTAEAMNTIRIGIQRQKCTSAPCPIFGHTWFDNLELNIRK